MNQLNQKLQSHGSVENTSTFSPLLALSFVIAIFSWIAHLGDPFSIDEFYTYWATSQLSLSASLQRVIFDWNQAPLYYLMPTILRFIGADSLVGLRVFSLLVAIASCYLVFKITASLLGDRIGIFAALYFIPLDGAIYQATNARPYALALFFALASLHVLQKTLEKPTAVRTLLLATTTSASFLTHYYYGGIILIQLFFILQRRDRPPFLSLLAAYTISALCCVPILLILITKGASLIALQLHGAPYFSDLLLIILPIAAAILFLLAFILGHAFSRTPWPTASALCASFQNSKALLFFWFLTPAVAAYTLALLANNSSILNSRFILWHLPAIAITLALIAATSANLKTQTIISIIFSAIGLSASLSNPISRDEWPKMFHALAEIQSRSPKSTLIYYSGTLELQRVDDLSNTTRLEMTRTPLRYYQIAQNAISLPSMLTDPAVQEFLTKTVSAQPTNPIVIFGQDLLLFNGELPSHFLKGFLQKQGFKAERLEYYKSNWVMTIATTVEG